MSLRQTQSGALLVLTGMAIIGLVDNFIIEVAKYSGLWQFHFLRALMALPMLIVIGRFLGQDILPQRWWAVGLRSLLLASSMMLYFGSIPVMPISLAIAGLFTSPIFVLIFSYLLFREAFGPVRLLAVALGFTGVLLILEPWSGGVSGAILLPIAGGVLYALNAIAARRLCADESTVAMLIGFFSALGLMGLIGVLILPAGGDTFLRRGYVPVTSNLLFWTFIQASTSILAVGLLTRAYQTSETTYLVVFEYSLLIFASFWGYMLYGQTVGPMAAAGMLLIVLSGVSIALRSGSSTSHQKSST